MRPTMTGTENRREARVSKRDPARKGKNDPRFGYATGRVRVLEGTLLSQDELTLFSARTTSLEVLRDILDKADYPDADELDDRISLEERKTDNELLDMGKQSLLPAALLLEKDYHNAKWLAKQLLLNLRTARDEQRLSAADSASAEGPGSAASARQDATNRSASSDVGAHDAAAVDGSRIFDLENPHGGDGKGFPPHIAKTLLHGMIRPEAILRELLALARGASVPKPTDPNLFAAMKTAFARYRATRDLACIDIELDKGYFLHLLAIADDPACGSEREFILDYCALRADGANLSSLLRAARADAGRSYLRSVLVEGGSAPHALVIAAYDEARALAGGSDPFAGNEDGAATRGRSGQSARNGQAGRAAYRATPSGALLRAFAASPLRKLLEAPLDFRTIEGIRDFGRDLDNALMDLARKGLRTSYGAETVAGYWIAKQMDVKNLRIMLACRDIDIEYDETVRLLRKAYRGYV